MKFCSSSIPQLMNGVSQQPASLRLPSQGERQVNCMSSVVDGLGKRPPTEHIAKLSASSFGAAAIHTINRDATERYTVIIKNGDLLVYDMTGAAMTVNFPDGKTYLNCTDPSTDFSVLTVADTTLICNRTKTVTLDAAGGGSLTGTKQTFSALPASPSNGDTYRIEGSGTENFDDYYVVYDGTAAVWKESVKPALQNTLTSTTMPHELVRTGVGTFTFRKIAWDSRLVGDADSNPAPSFVGHTINDIFLYKNRLGLFSDENYIYSEAGQDGYFNFWRTTVRQLLDSDPIDKSPGHTKVSILKYAIPFNKTLLAFSEQTQFIDTTEGVLSPQSAAISPSTEFEAKLTAKPVGVGKNIYFPVERGDYTGIKELFVDSSYNTVDAAETTSHVPQFIPKNVFKLAGSSNDNILLALTTDNQRRVYVNNFYFGPGADGALTKLQNAWHYWEFPEGDTVLSADFIQSTIYFVIERADGVYLEKMNTAAGTVESGFDFRVHLDRKVSLTGSYNAGTNKTTWTLPYEDDEDFMVIRGSSWSTNKGLPILGITRPTSSTIQVTGNYSANSCIIGRKYEARYRFSEQFMKENQGKSSVNSAYLQLRTFLLRYNKTGYFRIEVTPLNRSTYNYVFNARVLGSSNNNIGLVSLEGGDFQFPVYSRSDQVTIEAISDNYLPMYLLSAEWEAGVHLRTKRI